MLLFVIKKRGIFSMATVLIFIYTIISFCTILIDVFDAYGTNCPKFKINIEPTFVYCALLTLVIFPFYKMQDHLIKDFRPLKKTKFIDWIVYLYFSVFVLMVVLLTPDLLKNWAIAQVNPNLKGEIWEGSYDLLSLSGIPLFIGSRCLNIATGAIFVIPILFYNLAFRNKSKWFHLMTFCGSITIIFSSILTQDRSRFIYWGLMYFMCYVFIYKFLDKKYTRFINKASIVLGILIVSYIVIMNTRRFSDVTEIDNHNLFIINYAGQSFINFCMFYERLNLSTYNFEGIFPILTRLFGNGDELSTMDWASYVAATNGMNTLVFSSFIGFIMSYIGQFLTIIYCILLFFVSTKMIKRRDKYSFDLFEFMKVLVFICVPYLGLFGSFYHSHLTEIFTGFILFMSYKACRK